MAVIVALALALSSSMPVEMVPKDQRRFRGWDAEFRSVIGACDRKLCSAVRAIPLHQSPITTAPYLRANSTLSKPGSHLHSSWSSAGTYHQQPSVRLHFFPFRVQHQRQRRICHNAGHQFLHISDAVAPHVIHDVDIRPACSCTCTHRHQSIPIFCIESSGTWNKPLNRSPTIRNELS